MGHYRRKNAMSYFRNSKSPLLEIQDKKVRWCIYLFGANSGLTSYDFKEIDIQTVYHAILKMNSSVYEFERHGFSVPPNSYSLDDIIFKMNAFKSFAEFNYQYDSLVNLIILAVAKILELLETKDFNQHSSVQYYAVAIYEAITSLKFISHLLTVSTVLSQLFQPFWLNFLEQSTDGTKKMNSLSSNIFDLLTITPQFPQKYYSKFEDIYYSFATYRKHPFCPMKQISDVITGECARVSIWRLLILLIFSSSDIFILVLNLLESLDIERENIKMELDKVDKFVVYLKNREGLLAVNQIILYSQRDNLHGTKFITVSIDSILERFIKASLILNKKLSSHMKNVKHNFTLSEMNEYQSTTPALLTQYKSLLVQTSNLLNNFNNKLPLVPVYISHFKRSLTFYKRYPSDKSIAKHLKWDFMLARRFYLLLYRYSSSESKVICQHEIYQLTRLIKLERVQYTQNAAITLSVFSSASVNLLERTIMALFIAICKPKLIKFLQPQLEACLPYDIGGRISGLLLTIDTSMESNIVFSEKLVKLSGVIKTIEHDKRIEYLEQSLRTIFETAETQSIPSISSIEIMQSAERTPFMIKYQIQNRQVGYIYKYNDNLSHDLLTMQFIEACQEIFRLKGLKLYLCPYYVRPIICSDGVRGGIIGAINGVKSRQQIINSNISLEEYYRRTFTGNPSYQEAVSNFIHSLAAYSLVCYIFDVKDRNNGNLLITDQGHIIHIDFGFILGKFPGVDLKFELAPFKLDRDMIQLLGNDIESSGINKLTKFLIQGYLALREYHGYLIELLSLHKGGGIECVSEKSIDKFKRRLGVGLSVMQCRNAMKKCVMQAYGSKTTVMYDWMQSLQNKSRQRQNKPVRQT